MIQPRTHPTAGALGRLPAKRQRQAEIRYARSKIAGSPQQRTVVIRERSSSDHFGEGVSDWGQYQDVPKRILP